MQKSILDHSKPLRNHLGSREALFLNGPNVYLAAPHTNCNTSLAANCESNQVFTAKDALAQSAKRARRPPVERGRLD